MENKTKKINVGLLAYGMSGKIFHAPFLNLHEGFNLYAVTERNDKKAQNDYPDLISYHSVEDLLNDQAIQLVVINTPNNLHYNHSIAALKKGKNILVEKPFSATSEQAKEIFRIADENNRQVFFFQNRRWDSDFISVKKVIKSGELGKINEVSIRFDRYKNEISPKAFKETPVEASGLQYDLGPHIIDQVIHLFGKPISFHKILGMNRKGTMVDDFFSVRFVYPDSLFVTATTNMLVINQQPAYILHGTQGSYLKHRTDVQERQLTEGMRPDNPDYGIETSGRQGLLSTIDMYGTISDRLIDSDKGNYMFLFNAVYETLTNNQPFPILRQDILTQLEILES